MKLSLAFGTFLFLVSNVDLVHSHGTEVRHCIAPNGDLRIFVQHWHGVLGNPSQAGNMDITQPDGKSITLLPTGHVTNIGPSSNLSNLCQGGAQATLDNTCTSYNYYDDWVYYDFPGVVCDQESGVSYTLTRGHTVVLTEACSDLYPTTITVLPEDCRTCKVPDAINKYAVITRDNAQIAADNVYTGLAIGGTLEIHNQNQIQIHSNSHDLPVRDTFYKSLYKKFGGSRLQCNDPCTVAGVSDPLEQAGIDWADFEDLARSAKPSTDGDHRVFVREYGGIVNQADFIGLEAQDYDRGKTLVIFNTKEDITLTTTAYGRKWGPTVIAPFSKVTLDTNNDFIDGTVVAREFVNLRQGGSHLHGDAYDGKIECDTCGTPVAEHCTSGFSEFNYGLQPDCCVYDPTKFSICLDLTSASGCEEEWMKGFVTARNFWESVIQQNEVNNPDSSTWVRPSIVGTRLPKFYDGVYISSRAVPKDGPFGVLGSAGPTAIVGLNGLWRTYTGQMEFDVADLDILDQNAITEVILHEMGHVFGIGTLWRSNQLNFNDRLYWGSNVIKEWTSLGCPLTSTGAAPVVQFPGPPAHFDEGCFYNELMTPYYNSGAPNNPVSRFTIASLMDLGFSVDFGQAEPYQLPSGVDCNTCWHNRRLRGVDRKLTEDELQAAIDYGKEELEKLREEPLPSTDGLPEGVEFAYPNSIVVFVRKESGEIVDVAVQLDGSDEIGDVEDEDAAV